MKVGLTLGKFAPLHKGHQHLIETALAEMDHLIILIYDQPETTEVPLPVRAGWIQTLYPGAEVILCWDGPRMVGDTPEIQRLHEEYLLQVLGHRKVTHFYSSEFYGEHTGRALGAVNRQVDPERGALPISASQIRAAPYAHRHWLPGIVYRDLITNVVFVGAPSTGKSTIAERLAREYATVWMPEYGREYWETHQENRRLTLDQLVELAEGHLEREEQKLQEAQGYLFTDTNAITTYMFSLYYHGTAASRLAELAQQAVSRYDLVFLCDDDIPYDNTWDRSGDVFRQVFQRQIEADLLQRRIPFVPLAGTVAERVAVVRRVLQRYRKYHSLGELIL